MLAVNKDSLEYTCSITSVCDALLLDTSYKNKNSEWLDNVISDDERAFVVNRLEKALHHVVDIFGDAYIPTSLYIDNDGACGFSISFSDRVISDALYKTEVLDVMMTHYIVSYIKNEWYVLLGDVTENETSNEELWRSINSLFSYKYVPSYEIEEV